MKKLLALLTLIMCPANAANAPTNYIDFLKSKGVTSTGVNITGLSANTNLVPIAPYDLVVAGSANSPGVGHTSAEFLETSHWYRLRQSGTVQQISMYVDNVTALTGFWVKVWRQDGSGTFGLVGQSENLVSRFTAGTVNTLVLGTSIPFVQEGDFYGWRQEWSAGAANLYNAVTNQISLYHGYMTNTAQVVYDGAALTGPGYNWLGATTVNVGVPITLYATAPVAIAVGDSIISGATDTYSFVDGFATNSVPEVSTPFQIGTGLNATIQNLGKAGRRLSVIVPEFAGEDLSLRPRIAFLEGGVNDLIDGLTSATVLGYWTNLLASCQASNVVPVVSGILPFRSYGAATTAMLNYRDTINATLASMVGNYGGYYVSPDALGQYASDGPAGNAWTLQSQFDAGDGIHLSDFGKARWASLFQGATDAFTTWAALHLGSVSAIRIDLDGNSPSDITSGRNSRGLYGSPTTIQSGSAAASSTNQPAGDLILSSGRATGVGGTALGHIRFLTAGTGSSGTSDTIPVDRAYWRSGVDDSFLAFVGPAKTYKGGIGWVTALNEFGLFNSVSAGVPVLYTESTGVAIPGLLDLSEANGFQIVGDLPFAANTMSLMLRYIPGTGTATIAAFNPIATTYTNLTISANPVLIYQSTTNIAEFGGDATSGATRFWLWDNDKATLTRVLVGTNDSAGAGFKYLKIAN